MKVNIVDLRGYEQSLPRIMTDTKKLKVSLTKHGAHKVAQLLVKYGASAALKHTVDDSLAIDINLAQACKTLSAKNGVVPPYWDDILKLGQSSINSAVLVGIIFSHHELIQTMITSCGTTLSGTITYESFTSRKGFTNFKNDLYELGFAIHCSSHEVAYDLTSIVSDDRLGPYIKQILESKMKAAGWDGVEDSISEAIALGFHQVFGLPEIRFRQWLSGKGASILIDVGHDDFSDDSLTQFVFRSGHFPRSEIRSAFTQSSRTPKSQLKHNFLQSRLFEQLVVKYSAAQVGAEVPVGIGRACVDVCVKVCEKTTFFYEIKTSNSARACLREALGQAIEYAYWPAVERADKLIIVSPALATDDLISYMAFLRSRFDHCVYYQRIDLETGDLVGGEI